MKRIIIAVSLAVLILAVAVQAQTPAQKETESVERELIKLEIDWGKAFYTRDIAFVERFLADDYTGTEEKGIVMTKAQEIEDLRSGVHLSTSGVEDDMKVRVYGDAAVVTGRTTVKGQYQGKEFSSRYRWTHTFIKRDGRWQCVASHTSRISQK